MDVFFLNVVGIEFFVEELMEFLLISLLVLDISIELVIEELLLNILFGLFLIFVMFCLLD